MGEGLSRRGLLTGAATAGAVGVAGVAGCSAGQPATQESRPAAAQQVPKKGTAVVTLGTAGGPRVWDRSEPATAVVVDGTWHLVDCGAGTIRQLQAMGVTPDEVSHIWFTHLHSDHMADYAALVSLGWTSSRKQPLVVHGPEGTETMHQGALEFFRADIDTRTKDEGRTPPSESVQLADPLRGGQTLKSGGVQVTAVEVVHPPMKAFGYRFDTPDGSVALSGDTTVCDQLIEVGDSADLLVHEVMHLPSLGPVLKRNANAATLKKHLLASHTTTEQVGKVANRMGVNALALNHFVPTDALDRTWTDAPRKDFDSGKITLADDLMVFSVPNA